MKEEITTDQKKLHEKCHDMYSPKHLIRVMKFKIGRACGKQEKQIFLQVYGWTAHMERNHWESLCIDNLIILNLILVK